MNDIPPHDRGQALRERAEAILADRHPGPADTLGREVTALLHDLNVHQVELELQNEELRNTQQLVSRARDDYARLYNQAPVGYLTLDENGIILQANQTLGQMLHADNSAILSHPMVEFLADGDRDVFLARYKAFFKSPHEKNLEVVINRKEGGSFLARLTGRRETGSHVQGRKPEGGTMLLVVHDISEMRAAQDALQEEKERLAVTLRSIGDAVISTGVDGRITLVNRAAEELTGWTAAEATGRPLDEVFRLVQEHTRAQVPSPVEQVLRTGESFQVAGTTLLVNRQKSDRLVATRAAPIRDADNNVRGAVIAFRDTTEEARTQQEFQRMAKLDSLGVMAGGIAHDFNNLLSAIAGNMGLAHAAVSGGDREAALPCLMDGERAAMRARDLTRQLLTFSAGGKPVRRTFSLPPVVREAAGFALTGSRSRCQVEAPEDLWPVHADSGQVAQVLHNLLLNADQAMPQGGRVELTLANVRLGPGTFPLLAAGPYVRMDVVDQGVGIVPEIKDKVFDPFFTTKQRGSGLGLTSAYSIVRNHDGHITVESTPGKGSQFTVYLPALPEASVGATPLPGAGGATVPWRILMLDDEPLIATLGRRILTLAGHTVTTVADGKDALARFQEAHERGEPFHLCILDLTIPGGMGGKDVVTQLLRMDPSVRAVASSGYATDPIMANHAEYGFEECLPKPYTKTELLDLVAVLQAARKA